MGAERYQRGEQLGSGQMSIVWQALDTMTQETVALKIMTAIHEDDRRHQKARERFQREIEIARGLQHPHILPILDHGYMQYEQRRVPYLVTPYISDRSLVEVIKKASPWQSWSPTQILDVIEQATDSLTYLHTQQPPIVHADIKPGNFLCRMENRQERMVYLYLCDFGISHRREGPENFASELLGTFPFMAPEQFDRKIDPASDQYALAIMTCYMLTGKLPIQAATHEAYHGAHKNDRPLPPSVLNPQRVDSRSVDSVILRALEKQPARRYPSVQAFTKALADALNQYIQEQAAAPTLQEKIDTGSFATVPPARQTATVQEQEAVSRPSAEIGHIAIILDPPDTREDRILDEPLPARPVKVTTTRSDETLFRPLRLHEPVRIFLPARPRVINWAPTGSGLAGVCYGHEPIEIRADGSLRTIQVNRANGLCWSPDGRTLAITAPGTIHFWNSANQVAWPLVLSYKARTIDALTWSVNDQLAVWVADQLLVYTLPSDRLRSPHPQTSQQLQEGLLCGSASTLQWSPDGAWLAAGAANGTVRCWSTIDPLTTWQVTGPGPKVSALTWSQDSALLVVAFRDNRIIGWDVATQQEIFCWHDLPAMPRQLGITTDLRIVIASNERRLLVGSLEDSYPTHIVPGQLLVACSPRLPEIATLDEQREHILTIWR